LALELKTADDEVVVSDADLVAGGDKDTSYTIRFLTIEKNRELVKQHTKKVPNRRTHQMEDDTNWEAVSDAQFDYVLKDWKGVRVKGADVPCVPQFKQLVDGTRRGALLVKAGLNEVMAAPERRAESFREVEGVR
jgi:hypothetical protein